MITEQELLNNNFVKDEVLGTCYHYKPNMRYNFFIKDGIIFCVTELNNHQGLQTEISTILMLLHFLAGLKL